MRIFIRDNPSGQIISEVRLSLVEDAEPFEAYRTYDPLPFMGVSFKSTLPLDCELEIQFHPVTDKEWSRNLMNFPAYEKSQLSY